ncbi:death-associated protein 1 [Culicoides brevitarsis]|uniref:death-associated protein 1 n=1 Tax=Culicoides brevitarsis TaxID=469753 RepID=UPI00307CB4EA
MADEEQKLKAGHPPAVKAGGMRIVQHKSTNAERPGKDPVEVIGLSNPAPAVQTDVVATSKDTHNVSHKEHPAHHQKPVQNVPKPVVHNIQQPQK